MFVPWRSLVSDPEEEQDVRVGATTTANMPYFPWPIGLPPPGEKWPRGAASGFRPVATRWKKIKKDRRKKDEPIIVGLNLIV